MSDMFTIISSVLPPSARVIAFRGTEAISRPYEIEIFLTVGHEPGEEIDLADAIGAKAHLAVDRNERGVPPFLFAGVLADLEVLHAASGRLLCRALLVPRLWQLGLSRHSRIFTKMRVPDVITAVLAENGVTDVELRLGAYETEEHVCQYKESDLAFISRWMEREGIFYFFEHGEDGEKLVLCDQLRYDDDPVGAPVRYFPQLGGDRSAGSSLRSFRGKHRMVPAKVRLKDYDYAKPSLNVQGSADVAGNGAGEVVVYGDRFFSVAAGERLSRIRAEELRAGQVVFHGEGTRLHLRAGVAFELDEHPLASFNQRYLTVVAHHSGSQAAGFPLFAELTGMTQVESYLVEIDAISGAVQYRAPSVTPWPRVHGSENGVIDGPTESEYAQLDEQGRYLAKFKFDESKLKGGKATTWVRMMQPHGGDIEGFHFPLRKGTEVIFGFQNGDPDRPVIAGVVPNALNPSPVTSGNHTKNVIQTGGRNRFEFEDKAGQERVTMSTPYANTYVRMGSPNEDHELIIHTDQKTLLDAGLDYDVTVSNAGAGNWTTVVNQGNATLSVPQGYWGAGIESGFSVTAADGINFRINDGHDVPAAPAATEGFTVVVTQKGAEIHAQETITITSDAALSMTAPGLVQFHSTASDVVVHAHKELKIIADGEQHSLVAGKGWETTYGDSESHTEGNLVTDRKSNSSEETHGNSKTTRYGNQEVVTDGTTLEVTQGSSTDIFIGGQLSAVGSSSVELTQGLGAEIKLGLFTEITNAYKFALSGSAGIKLNFGVVIGNESMKHELWGEAVKAKSAALRNFFVYAHVGSLQLRTFGIHCHVP